MLWSKQFYHYLGGSHNPGSPPPPAETGNHGCNSDWTHLDAATSMPEEWSIRLGPGLPLRAAGSRRPDFAKNQLIPALGASGTQHPNRQLPAYEWNFGDVNPPTRLGLSGASTRSTGSSAAKAISSSSNGPSTSLLLTFTWWVNRKHARGLTFFKAASLLDNIGVFDRSAPLQAGISNLCRRSVRYARL